MVKGEGHELCVTRAFSLRRGVMWARKAIYRTWSQHQRQDGLHSLQDLMQNKILGPLVEELRNSRWQLQSIKPSAGPYVSTRLQAHEAYPLKAIRGPGQILSRCKLITLKKDV